MTTASTTRPFRFGLMLRAPTFAEWLAKARRADELGYSTLLVNDHVSSHWGPIAAMTAVATCTTRLRVGAMVISNDFRHPVLLAKELSTIDAASQGRLEIGLGAGWWLDDYAQLGLTRDPAATRIERLEEAVEVIRRIMTGTTVAFTGRHYRVDDPYRRPRPVQQPHPPFMVGGGGRRVLGLAARAADIVGIHVDLGHGAYKEGMLFDGRPERTAQRVEWVREAAGDRFPSLELTAAVFHHVHTDARSRVLGELAEQSGLAVADVADIPHLLVGTPEQMAEDLVRRRERYGISYVMLQDVEPEQMAPLVELLRGR